MFHLRQSSFTAILVLKITLVQKGCVAKLSAKSKKCMIEIGGVGWCWGKGCKSELQLVKVSARVSGKNLVVASVNENCELSWHDTVPGASVREAVESFMEEME